MAQERRVAKNLQLQDEPGSSAPYMELQDTGQGVADQWQLRDDVDVTNWQPIEYQRSTPPKTNWILPSLVGVMLLAVLSYVGWVGYMRFGPGSTAAVPGLATATTAVDAAVGEQGGEETAGQTEEPIEGVAAVQQETATPTPEPTLPAAVPVATEPAPEPTVVLVDQRIATITNQYGVNARLEPNTTSDVLRVLEQGETAIVVDELTDADGVNWLQVQISEGALVWISAEFAEITTRQVAAEPGSVAAAPSVTTTVETEVPAAPGVDVSITISSPFGLNARALPNPDAEIITLLDNAQTLPAIARSQDNTWVQVQLEDGTLAWVFLELVTTQGDLTSLPVLSGDEAAISAPTNVLTGTQAVTETVVPPSTGVITETAPATGAPLGTTVVVSSTLGVNARSTASTEAEVLTLLPAGTELEAIGQNADGSWIQVALDDGTLAWIFAAALQVGPGVANLPQAVPPAVGAEAERLPSIESTVGVTTTAPLVETAPVTTTESVSPTIPIVPTAPVTATEAITETGAITTPADAPPAPEGATATVTGLIGTSVRPAPNTTQPAIQTLASGTVLPLLGRTEDGQWVQVQLADGSLAWAFARNVSLNVNIDELPITAP